MSKNTDKNKNNKIPKNFKNYHIYIKKWNKSKNTEKGDCSVCLKHKKISNETCYKCYQKAYDKNVNYADGVNDFTKVGKTKISKKYLSIPAVGFLVGSAIVAIPILSITIPLFNTRVKISGTKDDEISTLKTNKKAELNNINKTKNLIAGATLANENQLKNDLDAAKTKGNEEIEAATTIETINNAFTTNQALVIAAKEAYENAIEEANQKVISTLKTNKKAELNNINKTKNLIAGATLANENQLKNDLDAAKIKGNEEIEAATTFETINNAFATNQVLVIAARDTYENAIEQANQQANQQVISTLKTNKKAELNNINKTKNLIAGATLANENQLKNDLDAAKTKGNEEIEAATTIETINNAFTTNQALVIAAKEAYENAIEEANQQAISTLKSSKKDELNNINKTKNLIAGATLANENQLKNDLDAAKTKGNEEIEAATTIETINNAFTTNQALVIAAKEAYENAIEEANQQVISTLKSSKKDELNNINKTKNLIAGATLANENQLKNDLDAAKTKGNEEIEAATTIETINNAFTTNQALVIAAKEAYENAIEEANQQAISTLKSSKKDELNNINKTKNLIAGATLANENQLKNDLDAAKTKGNEEIEAATTIETINNAFTTNQVLVIAAKEAYENAIEEANQQAISTLKSSKNAELNNINKTKNLIAGATLANKDQLINNLAAAKTKGNEEIEAATTIETINNTFTPNQALVIVAKEAYENAIEQANQQAISTLKTNKKAELNNINKTKNLIAGATLANKDQLINNLAAAKTKGNEEIETATTIETINNAFTTNQALVNAAKKAYDDAIEQANNKKQEDNLISSKQEAEEVLKKHYNDKKSYSLNNGEINKNIKENWENALVSALNNIKDINEITLISKIKDEEILKIDKAFEQYQKNISFLNYLNKIKNQNTTKSNTYASSLMGDTNQSSLGISIGAEFQIIKDELLFIGKTYDNVNGTLLVELFYKINENITLSGQITIIGYAKTNMKVNSFNYIPENTAVHKDIWRHEVIRSWTFNFYDDKNILIYSYKPGLITSDFIENTNYKGHIKRITVRSSDVRQYAAQTTHVARIKFFDGIKMWIFNIDKNEESAQKSYRRVNQSFDLN